MVKTKVIEEVVKRFCCQAKDLEILHPKEALGLNRLEKERLDRYCKHCGTEFEYYRYMDAAGSMDWNYRPKKDQ